MTVLGLDFGGNFGYAVSSDGVTMHCGTADLSKLSKQLRCSKPSALYGFLRDLVVQHAVNVVCWEDTVTSFMGAMQHGKKKENARYRLGDALAVHAEYRAIVQLVADQKNLRVVPAVANVTLKKFGAGHGHADKRAMIAAANRLYRLDLDDGDDNAADACHVCAWAVQKLKGNDLLDGATLEP